MSRVNEHARILEQMFGAPPELIPVLDDLLAELSVLGGWTQELTEVLERCGLPEGARLLDLGCGKGAIATALARRFRIRVHGIDLYEPFIRSARQRAEHEGVAHLCTFEAADFSEVIERGADYDAALMSAVGCELFGGYAECIGAMRATVRAGGLLVLADGCLAQPAPILHEAGCGYLQTRDQALRQCTSHGDELVAECIVDADKVAATNRSDTESVRRRAESLKARRPDLSAALDAFVAHQEHESGLIDRWILETIWVFHKTECGSSP